MIMLKMTEQTARKRLRYVKATLPQNFASVFRRHVARTKGQPSVLRHTQALRLGKGRRRT